MSLFDLEGKKLTKIPRTYKAFYDARRRNLSDEQYLNIMTALYAKLDEVSEKASENVVCSSYVPGNDWEGTVYWPIYEACGLNKEDSGYMFGLLFWEAVILHCDNWKSVKQSKADGSPLGRAYFRVD